MLLRLIAENILSFKDATEFNTFTSSKSQSHDNHRIECGHATVLRMSAIYGANGAGKSNLLLVLNFLQSMVQNETLHNIGFYDNGVFKLDLECKNKPSGIAIEFCYNENVFYYHIEFSNKEIISSQRHLSENNTFIHFVKFHIKTLP